MENLNIYFVTTVADVVVAEGEDQYGYCCQTEEQTVGHLVCAASRGKVRQWVCKEYDLWEYTYPMSIRKVKHELTQDELSEGELGGGWFIDDDMVLHDYSELDDLISQHEHEQEMLAMVYEGES